MRREIDSLPSTHMPHHAIAWLLLYLYLPIARTTVSEKVSRIDNRTHDYYQVASEWHVRMQSAII